MSFSSDISSASISSSESISTAPSPRSHNPPESHPQSQFHTPQKSHHKPNYKTLESLLLSTIGLARASFTPHSHFGINTPTMHYLSLHARVNKFLTKWQKWDFVQDGTYGFVLEISILMRLVESALGVGHRDLVGVECGGKEARCELERLEKKCNRDVEYLVFGGRDVDVGRLPWNLNMEGAVGVGQ